MGFVLFGFADHCLQGQYNAKTADSQVFLDHFAVRTAAMGRRPADGGYHSLYGNGRYSYNFNNGRVDTSVQPTVATPSNAESVDDLLATLEQMNKDDAGSDTALKQEVADALLEGARDQAEDLDEETIVKLEDALLEAYGINIKKIVEASGSNADKDLEVTATGLLLASGLKPEDAKSKEIELQVEQATPSTAEKVVFDVKLEKYTCKVTHTHGDGNKDTETANIKETEEGLILYLRAVSFSEFELTATLKNTSSGSSTGGGSSVSSSAATGKWVKAADGIRWWYQNSDGTWPAGGWAQLPWNGKTDWYYFDAEGYMVTGWITWEGSRYYLHPVADGTQGHMYTGWNEIGGQYYYFRPESGGPQGSLFVNGTTPDGYSEGPVWRNAGDQTGAGKIRLRVPSGAEPVSDPEL